jgi:hypothetical protein
MNFTRLQGIEFKRGLYQYQEKQSKYPFITYKDTYFKEELSPDFLSLTKQFGYSFFQQTLSGTKFFYLSEPNLIEIFANSQEFYVDYRKPITNEIVEEIKTKFYEGYKFGQFNFTNEIGNSFSSFSIEYKKSYIEGMGQYCLKHLFFDGFAVPEYIYALGYIQACLFLACKEYEKILSYETSVIVAPGKSEDNTGNKTLNNKIEIARDYRNDVISLWNSLQDVALYISSELANYGAFKDKKAITKILGMLFFETADDALIPDIEKKQLTISGNKDLVNSVRACMYLTYKLNNEKGSLAKYASVLKETFSCFNNNAESSIQTNLSKSVVPFVKLLKKINKDRASIALDVISKNNLTKTVSFD